MTVRIGSMFSGWGGLDLGVSAALDAETVWVCDIESGPRKILAHRFPHAPNHGDVTAVDWATVEPVDVLLAGFPCTDVSQAGAQAGLVHGTRSGLFHEVIRAIRDLGPALVVLENVRGIFSADGDERTEEHKRAQATVVAATLLIHHLDRRHAVAFAHGRTEDARTIATRRGRAMGCRNRAMDRTRRHQRHLVRAIGTVLGELANLGLDAEWVGVQASDVGAPHKRWRWFLIAWPADSAGDTWGLIDRNRLPTRRPYR